MINTISLVDIHQHKKLQNFFPCDENFNICSLSSFQVHNTVLLTMVATLYIISVIDDWKFVSFNSLYPFHLPLISVDLFSVSISMVFFLFVLRFYT